MRVQISTPPNTSKNNPQVSRLDYGRETLSHVQVKIPKGHAYLTGFQLRAGNSAVIVPEAGSNTEWIVDDDRTLIIPVKVVFDPPTFKLEFRTYNEDDTYPHSHYIDLE